MFHIIPTAIRLGRDSSPAMASLLCLVAITAIALLPAAAAGQGGKIMRPSWAPDCSTADNYTADSQYKRNLDQLLAALPAAAGDSGWFYESSAGAGDDEVYGCWD